MSDNEKIKAAQQMQHIQELYTSTPAGAQFAEELARSLTPRGANFLLDLVDSLGLSQACRILDVGCGYCKWSLQLAERLAGRVLAIDIVPSLLEGARQRVDASKQAVQFDIREASIYAIPAESASIDLVWSRDMLNHIEELGGAMCECYRVLRPGGLMMVYQTFAGALLEAREADRLYRALGIVPENMSTHYAESAFAEAGFVIQQKHIIASEWREQEIEGEDTSLLKDLLQAGRLLRQEEHFVGKYGRRAYEQALGDAQWKTFIALGKLLPVAYVLRRAEYTESV